MMFAGTQLVSIQLSTTPFITQSPFISNQMVKTYFNSIDSHLQGKGGAGYADLIRCVDSIRADGTMKAILDAANGPTAGNPYDPTARPLLFRLDKVAYEIKA